MSLLTKRRENKHKRNTTHACRSCHKDTLAISWQLWTFQFGTEENHASQLRISYELFGQERSGDNIHLWKHPHFSTISERKAYSNWQRVKSHMTPCINCKKDCHFSAFFVVKTLFTFFSLFLVDGIPKKMCPTSCNHTHDTLAQQNKLHRNLRRWPQNRLQLRCVSQNLHFVVPHTPMTLLSNSKLCHENRCPRVSSECLSPCPRDAHQELTSKKSCRVNGMLFDELLRRRNLVTPTKNPVQAVVQISPMSCVKYNA